MHNVAAGKQQGGPALARQGRPWRLVPNATLPSQPLSPPRYLQEGERKQQAEVKMAYDAALQSEKACALVTF